MVKKMVKQNGGTRTGLFTIKGIIKMVRKTVKIVGGGIMVS